MKTLVALAMITLLFSFSAKAEIEDNIRIKKIETIKKTSQDSTMNLYLLYVIRETVEEFRDSLIGREKFISINTVKRISDIKDTIKVSYPGSLPNYIILKSYRSPGDTIISNHQKTESEKVFLNWGLTEKILIREEWMASCYEKNQKILSTKEKSNEYFKKHFSFLSTLNLLIISIFGAILYSLGSVIIKGKIGETLNDLFYSEIGCIITLAIIIIMSWGIYRAFMCGRDFFWLSLSIFLLTIIVLATRTVMQLRKKSKKVHTEKIN